MKRNRFITTAVTVLTVLLCAALCAAVLVIYGTGTRDTAADIFTREAVGKQLLYVAPVAVCWLAAVLAAAVAGHPGGDPSQGAPNAAESRALVRRKRIREPRVLLRGILYFAAVVLVVLGVLNGGMNDVLVKAIHICTECIGLG